MKPEIVERIRTSFSAAELPDAIAQLERLSLADVMANSQTNLDNTLLAAVLLSDGNISKLRACIDAAKLDFRDVIYQASLAQKQSGKNT